MQTHISRLAAEYLLKHNITKLPLKFEDLCKLIASNGYEITTYNEIEQNGLSKELKLDIYKCKEAYSMNCKGTKIVCYDDGLSYAERNFALAHELSHDELKHIRCGFVGKSANAYDNEQEIEADAMAYYLLAPPCVLAFSDVYSVKDVQSMTLLDETRAKEAYINVLETRAAGRETLSDAEKELLESFRAVRLKKILDDLDKTHIEDDEIQSLFEQGVTAHHEKQPEETAPTAPVKKLNFLTLLILCTLTIGSFIAALYCFFKFFV